MSTRKSRQVYLCDVCKTEHDTEASADACEKAHQKASEFAALQASYKKLRAKVRARCKHPKPVVLAIDHNAIDMTDARYTEYTKHCPDCDKIWQDRG